MTREEAIKKFEAWAECKYEPTRQAALMAISALRAQQTPLDRSRWEGCEFCSKITDKGADAAGCLFCPVCGRPLKKEAWAELERRMGKLKSD